MPWSAFARSCGFTRAQVDPDLLGRVPDDTNQRGLTRHDASQRGNTAIYFIDAKGLAGSPSTTAPTRRPRPGPGRRCDQHGGTFLENRRTESLAENTGGRRSPPETPTTPGGLERVTQEFLSTTAAAYQRRIRRRTMASARVKVSRPGEGESRRGYQAHPQWRSTLQKTTNPARPSGRRVRRRARRRSTRGDDHGAEEHDSRCGSRRTCPKRIEGAGPRPGRARSRDSS